MSNSAVEVWWRGGAALAESPFWSPAEACFYWVDISGKRIWRHDGSARPAQSWQLTQSVGCIALRAAGGLIAALEDGVYALQLGADSSVATTLITPALHGAGMRFNDGRCDRQGRFWVGSMHDDAAAPERLALGRLARLDGQQWAPALKEAMLVPNGLAFSPRGDKLYFSDSAPSIAKVWVCDYDIDSGRAGTPQIFIEKLAIGRPDGAAVDIEGGYWICANDGAAVLRYAPDGRLDRRIALPVAKPTMCAFGGDDMATLLVASMRPAGIAGDTQPLAGALFALRPGIAGLAETACLS